LRALLGYDRKLCAEVVSAFVEELSRSLRFRAKHTLGLKSVNDAHTGAVAAIQRTPTRAEVATVARRTAERMEKILRAHGRRLDTEMQDDEPAELELCRDQPGLAACYAAAARGAAVKSEQAALRLVVSQDRPQNTPVSADADAPVAEVRGVNVHAKQLVDGRDRALCRPAPAEGDQLELFEDHGPPPRRKRWRGCFNTYFVLIWILVRSAVVRCAGWKRPRHQERVSDC
jgi:hypothetical protein